MSKYLIKLTPLTPYFFGGEDTFGADNRDYFVRSNYMPQQTTILGFLRYELLAQNHLLLSAGNDKRSEWPNLIGKSGFNINDKGEVFDQAGDPLLNYGAIKSISPVFLSNEMENYIPQSMDWALAKDAEITVNGYKVSSEILRPIEVDFAPGTCHTTKSRDRIPAATVNGKPYDPKYGLQALWIKSDGTIPKQWDHDKEFNGPSTKHQFKKSGFSNGFFIEQEQVGIHKVIGGSKGDKGFYRQVFYKLVDNFAFTFFAEIDLPAGKVFADRIISMGGERSMFKMVVQESTTTFEDTFTKKTFEHPEPNHRKLNALVLTSDAYADASILNDCDYAITDSVPFRYISTKQDDTSKNYAKLGEGTAKTKHASLLYLLKRGSIFYGDNLQKVEEELDKHTGFKTIGYNHYIQIPKPTQQ